MADSNNFNLEALTSSSLAIIRWCTSRFDLPVASSSFGPYSLAFLHLLSRANPDVPVIWVDTKFNTSETLDMLDFVKAELQLDVRVFAAEHELDPGDIPPTRDPGDSPRQQEIFDSFVRKVKLDPFAKALKNFNPDCWLTGIRREETEYRNKLTVVNAYSDSIMRVAPMLFWSIDNLRDYHVAHGLPYGHPYTDPTKPGEKIECGIQIARSG